MKGLVRNYPAVHAHLVDFGDTTETFNIDEDILAYEENNIRRTNPNANEMTDEHIRDLAMAHVIWTTHLYDSKKTSHEVHHRHHHGVSFRTIALITAAILLVLFLGTKAHGQTVSIRGATKGTTAANTATVTATDANHSAMDVNILGGGGTGGGPADVGATTAASETDITRQKVTSAIRVLDTGQGAGSQLVALKGDSTSGAWVNCKSGCAGGSTTPADGFATPTTTGISTTFAELWNGTTWDRWKGDATNGAFVNIKNSVALGVTGTFWQATQPVSIASMPSTPVTGTFFQATQPVSNAGTFAVQIQSNASINEAQINGVTPLMGNGTSGTGSQRVNIASDNTAFETIHVATATTTNTTTPHYLASAATTNATSVKASAGNVYGLVLLNTTTTVYYLRMYNLAAAPTCSSATGFVRTYAIPPSPAAGQVGGLTYSLAVGNGYATGIAYCLTGGPSSTDNTAAATGVEINIDYK